MICRDLMSLGTISVLTSKEWKLFRNTLNSEWTKYLKGIASIGEQTEP